MKIKFVLAVLVILFLLRLPADYNQIIRFVLLVGFAYLGYDNLKSNTVMAVIFFALAVLYQPLAPIKITQNTWNIIDVLVAAGLVYSAFTDRK